MTHREVTLTTRPMAALIRALAIRPIQPPAETELLRKTAGPDLRALSNASRYLWLFFRMDCPVN
jgi:hypothetical protein